jgi:hypothetical protein
MTNEGNEKVDCCRFSCCKPWVSSKAWGYMLVTNIVTTLALGLRPKHGFARGWAKRETWECGRVWEWTLTLPSELPCWELESTLESDCKGQNPSPWGNLYIIGNLLKHRCPKCARMTHLDIWNTSYDQKKVQESNWQFDSRPRKVRNWHDSLRCRWHATCRWKALDEVYNFGWNLIPIGRLHKKLWTYKVARVSTLIISGFPLGSPGTKNLLNATPTWRCKVYYMGEGGGFPRIRAVVSFMSLRSPVVLPSIKGAPTLC